MNSNSNIDILRTKDLEVVDLIRTDGEFELENGNKIPWKSYTLKVKIEGVVFSFKLNKVFNDTMQEILRGE